MVCIFHLVCFTPNEINNTVYNIFFEGRRGVEIFFVISGIVIPLSMFKAGYTIKNFSFFLKKRIVRIEPPYLVALVLSILVELIRHFLLGRDFLVEVSLQNVLLHIGYLVPFVETSAWFNGVFWTLAIEFQFYLFMALSVPLLFSGKILNRILFYSILLIISFLIRDDQLFPYWSPLFGVGILYVALKTSIVSIKEFTIVLLLFLAVIAIQISIIDAFIGILVVLLVEFFGGHKNSIGKFLGKISYSLYLVHLPITYKITYELLKTTQNSFYSFCFILLGILLSILIALIFYKLVEEPAKKWAKNLG
jgi:hypothetical protein